MKVLALFAGKKRPFGLKSGFSGIDKRPVEQALVSELGMIDDIQVDKRFHGGPERALHQYALSSYETIIKQFPLLYKKAWPGSIGENISSNTMADDNVCIGDIYQIGEIKVQVSSPRIPCWKISHKFNMRGVDKVVASHAITGWYYRILQTGSIKLGDEITLLERPNPDLSIKKCVKLHYHKDPAMEHIKAASKAVGLDPEWQEKMARRII